MKWLFATSQFPWPIIHGRWLRVYHLARTLVEQGEAVSVLSCEATDQGRSAYADIGVGVVEGPDRPHRAAGAGRCLFAPCAFDEGFAKAVERRAGDFEAVALSGTRMLQYAREAGAAGVVVSEMVDDPLLEFGRREAGRRLGAAARLRSWKNRIGQIRLERSCSPFVAFTSFVSEQDCASFNRRHPGARTVFVPNGVDVEYFARPGPGMGDEETGPPTVVFTGHMSNPNNQRAAVYLARDVAPLLWREMPDARVLIVGADPPEAVLSLASDRVLVTGRVEDMRPFLWKAGVVLLSMQSGTGIKNKLLEAWAASAPVVATPISCQGVPARDGENLILGDSAEALAGATIELLRNPRRRDEIAAAGRKTVVSELTWGAAARTLIAEVSGARSPCR